MFASEKQPHTPQYAVREALFGPTSTQTIFVMLGIAIDQRFGHDMLEKYPRP